MGRFVAKKTAPATTRAPRPPSPPPRPPPETEGGPSPRPGVSAAPFWGRFRQFAPIFGQLHHAPARLPFFNSASAVFYFLSFSSISSLFLLFPLFYFLYFLLFSLFSSISSIFAFFSSSRLLFPPLFTNFLWFSSSISLLSN